jgi:pimeloyl-ACP methyl ester carboxylesterase
MVLEAQMSKKVKLSLIISVVTLVVLMGSFLIYVACGYKADDVARSLYEAENVEFMDGYAVISPKVDMGVGLIFYPGANVEYTAYLPLMDQLSDIGITCYLMKMPFNMAIMDAGRADVIFENHGDEHSLWLIGGHSMGGAMASQYASENQDKIDGLILLGAYPYKEYPLEKTLTIYGSLNTSVEEKLDYTENVHVIEGGNHAYFGNYGEQAGDSVGEISREEQQRETVELIAIFVLELIIK